MDKNNKILKEVIDWIKTIIIAVIIALFVNNVIITNSKIPTGSMEENIPVGSRIFGSRLHYKFTDIKRGDVVIFDYGYQCKNCGSLYQKNDEKMCPNCNRKDSDNDTAYYIKRVIGLPCDHIEIKNDYIASSSEIKGREFLYDMNVKCGHVYINGEKIDEDYINGPMIIDDGFYKTFDIVVPENSYFLLGDNRNDSEDARFWNKTFIEKKDIIAKAMFIYWPFNKIGLIK